MTFDVRFVPYGQPAAEALRVAIAGAKGADPLAPVTVVVPSNHVGVAARRRLASGRLGPVTTSGTGIGIAAATFVTPFRLAELLGAGTLAAAGKRPVSIPVLAAAMRAELTAQPGIFAPVADHPATESALVATYRELRDLSPGALDSVAATSGRAAEVIRLHRAVRSRLADTWSDEEDLLLAAVDQVRSGAPAIAELGAVVVHLPQRLSRHAAQLVVAVSDVAPTTVIAALTGSEAADDEVRRSLARLGIEVPTRPVAPVDHRPGTTTILTASDADEEVRAAVRAVLQATRSGVRLDRIAVLHASPEPYARLTHDQLRAAGVTTNGAAVVPLSARIAGRTLLELLRLPDARFRRQDVFAWLSSAPILHEGRWAPTTAWERISRDAAVVADRADWDERLARFVTGLDERLGRMADDDEVADAQLAQLRSERDRAEALREFVLDLIGDLQRAARPKRWSEHAAWGLRTLGRLLGPATRREEWPLEERRAAERVELALHRLGALDAVEDSVTLDVFTRTLEIELEGQGARVGRLGDGVLVGSVEMGLGLDLDLVVVLGLAEGSFPSTVRDDSLLPDRERAAAGDELGLRADRVERQHHQLLGTLAGATSRLLCVPRGDLRKNAERTASRWVLDVASDLAGTGERWWSRDLLRSRDPWATHVASFDDGLRSLTEPATEQEHRLRQLLADDGRLDRTNDPVTARGAFVVSERRSSRFTRFDGNLAGMAVPSPVELPMSATRLERWAACPHAHFVLDVLGVAPVENPEDELMITAIDKGQLVHEALEVFLSEVLSRPPEQRPGPRDPWSPADRDRLGAVAEEICERYEQLGLTGRPIYWRLDRRHILEDLDTFLVRDSGDRTSRATTPLAVELGFGMKDADLEPVRFPLPDGRHLQVRGRADRIDLAEDGTLHVIDYKTGKADPYRRLSEDNPVEGGTRLQLPIYGLAGRLHQGAPHAPVVAEYWFVTRRGDFKRHGYRVTDEVLATASAAIGAIVDGIEAGTFPPHPDKNASTAIFITCEVCDPDGLGTVDLRRQWERKRSDPALARYADLAEPLEEPA